MRSHFLSQHKHDRGDGDGGNEDQALTSTAVPVSHDSQCNSLFSSRTVCVRSTTVLWPWTFQLVDASSTFSRIPLAHFIHVVPFFLFHRPSFLRARSNDVYAPFPCVVPPSPCPSILSSHGMGGGLPSWREETPRRDGGIRGGAWMKAPLAVCNVWRIEAHADAREPCTWDEADGGRERCGWMDDVDVRAKEKGVGWKRET